MKELDLIFSFRHSANTSALIGIHSRNMEESVKIQSMEERQSELDSASNRQELAFGSIHGGRGQFNQSHLQEPKS